MNKGAFAYMNNHGWRSISVAERAQALAWVNSFVPNGKKQQRAKTILELFIRDNLSAQAIERLRHPDIVSIGNRSRGRPLSAPAILSVIYEYFPQFRGRNRGGNKKDSRRIELMRKREIMQSPHIKACAHCGGMESLEEHHMIPLILGGTNDDANLVYLCKNCHMKVTQYQSMLTKRRTELLNK